MKIPKLEEKAGYITIDRKAKDNETMVEWWTSTHFHLKDMIGIQKMTGPTGEIFKLKSSDNYNIERIK